MQYGNQPPGPPQYGAPPPWGPPFVPAPPTPGCLMPSVWLVATIILTLVGAVFVGGMASTSETNGVQAAQLAAIPFGFAWGGLLSATIIQFAWKQASAGVRVGGPLGCGCLGAIVMILVVIVFFAAIFPAL